MPTAVIVDAVRTAGGKRNGKLSGWHPADLAAEVLTALVERNDIDPGIVEDVIMGCVMQVGSQSVNIARNAVLAAGWPESVPGTTVDRQCGSSQQAAHFAAQAVIAGVHDVVVAVGRRGHEPGPDGRLDRRRQVRVPVRAPGRAALRRRRRARAPGHLGRVDRRQVGPLPRAARRASPPRASAGRPGDAPRAGSSTRSSPSAASTATRRPATSASPTSWSRPTKASARARPSTRWPTSSRRSSRTARSPPATPARSPTAPPPR